MKVVCKISHRRYMPWSRDYSSVNTQMAPPSSTSGYSRPGQDAEDDVIATNGVELAGSGEHIDELLELVRPKVPPFNAPEAYTTLDDGVEVERQHERPRPALPYNPRMTRRLMSSVAVTLVTILALATAPAAQQPRG